MASTKGKQIVNVSMKQRAREMLIEGKTVKEVCTALGVAHTTIYRLRNKPDFAARLDRINEARLKLAEDRVRAMIEKAHVIAEGALDLASDCPWPSRVKVMAEVYDRVGLVSKAGPSTIVQTVTSKLTPEELADAARYLAESQKAPTDGG